MEQRSTLPLLCVDLHIKAHVHYLIVISEVTLCVRDLEGGPNCRVSACQGFITKQRYKRVVIFACDLTTRTE